ncbi:MAG: hypothetical protein EOP00_29430 [Pedobacter sp.]|nr:MAG: hypothetical protein EOP00_29430 [Pedobacter sp.]
MKYELKKLMDNLIRIISIPGFILIKLVEVSIEAYRNFSFKKFRSDYPLTTIVLFFCILAALVLVDNYFYEPIKALPDLPFHGTLNRNGSDAITLNGTVIPKDVNLITTVSKLNVDTIDAYKTVSDKAPELYENLKKHPIGCEQIKQYVKFCQNYKTNMTPIDKKICNSFSLQLSESICEHEEKKKELTKIVDDNESLFFLMAGIIVVIIVFVIKPQ